jgi:hypothetical protein
MSERDVLTVDFFPEKNPFPQFTPEDYLKQTAEDMLHLLKDPASSPHIGRTFGSPVFNAFQKIAHLLSRATTPAPSPVRVPRVLEPFSSDPSQRVPVVLPKKNSFPSPPLPALNILHQLAQFVQHNPTIANKMQSVQHDPTIAGKMFHPVTGRPKNIDTLLRSLDSITWTTSLANEWARCAQGLSSNRPADKHVVGTNTIFFIRPHQVPAGRKVTYANFVCTMRPGKAERYRIHMTVGGDRLDAYQDVRSPAVGITDTKLHINSAISDAKNGARYCTGDLKDFFLCSIMKIFQYMRVHRRYIPQEILDAYALDDTHFDSKGYAYLEIRKGMYGLKEASILAYNQLKEHLALYSYAPVRVTPGLWRHNTRRTVFTLAVDDFGIKYFCKADADHLFSALKDKYELTQDWSGNNYLGLTLGWNYTAPPSLRRYLHAQIR